MEKTEKAKWKRGLENFLEDLEDKTEGRAFTGKLLMLCCALVPSQFFGGNDRTSGGNDWVVQ